MYKPLATATIGFRAVEITATLAYLLTTTLVVWVGFDTMLANMVGFSVSILVSSLGHHASTFRLEGG